MAEFLPNIVNLMLTSQHYLIRKFKTAPCIAVIDESNTPSTVTTDSVVTGTTQWPISRFRTWAAFRSSWPLRPYYLLKVRTAAGGDAGTLNIPTNMQADIDAANLTYLTNVNRDNGTVANRSDWFAIANLSTLEPGDSVFIFVDNSGSMTEPEVRASYNFFITQCNAASINVYKVTNGFENYISPFITWSARRTTALI